MRFFELFGVETGKRNADDGWLLFRHHFGNTSILASFGRRRVILRSMCFLRGLLLLLGRIFIDVFLQRKLERFALLLCRRRANPNRLLSFRFLVTRRSGILSGTGSKTGGASSSSSSSATSTIVVTATSSLSSSPSCTPSSISSSTSFVCSQVCVAGGGCVAICVRYTPSDGDSCCETVFSPPMVASARAVLGLAASDR